MLAWSGCGGAAVVRLTRQLNMNALGDDHVSFSAAHLALSPTGDLLLVSTDTGRLVLWDLAGACVRACVRGRVARPYVNTRGPAPWG